MSSDLSPPEPVPVVLLLYLTARRRKVDVLRRALADRPDKPSAFLPEVHTWGDWRDRLSELEGIVDVLYRDEERDCWVVLDYKSDAAAEGVLAMKYAPPAAGLRLGGRPDPPGCALRCATPRR